MVEMEVLTVQLDASVNSPVVVLRELTPPARLLPILIGHPEATAISWALDQTPIPRPMTHDLLQDVIEDLGAHLRRIVVTHLHQGTFYAELTLSTDSGERVVSSRPSDAIALALRVGCPILVDEGVLEIAGVLPEEVAEAPVEVEGDVVEQFREFIDSINPDDFNPAG
ncbi:MAG: bifunctional nuclease family protein [Acidobacteria bacterium]|nr:bifunctional nuclease family protein [Acidobacteriota bacterium]